MSQKYPRHNGLSTTGIYFFHVIVKNKKSMATREALPSSIYTYVSGSLASASAITPTGQTMAKRRETGESRLVLFNARSRRGTHTLLLSTLSSGCKGAWEMKSFVDWPCAQLRLWKVSMNFGGQLPVSATHNQGRKETRWQSPRKHCGLVVELEISLSPQTAASFAGYLPSLHCLWRIAK